MTFTVFSANRKRSLAILLTSACIVPMMMGSAEAQGTRSSVQPSIEVHLEVLQSLAETDRKFSGGLIPQALPVAKVPAQTLTTPPAGIEYNAQNPAPFEKKLEAALSKEAPKKPETPLPWQNTQLSKAELPDPLPESERPAVAPTLPWMNPSLNKPEEKEVASVPVEQRVFKPLAPVEKIKPSVKKPEVKAEAAKKPEKKIAKPEAPKKIAPSVDNDLIVTAAKKNPEAETKLAALPKAEKMPEMPVAAPMPAPAPEIPKAEKMPELPEPTAPSMPTPTPPELPVASPPPAPMPELPAPPALPVPDMAQPQPPAVTPVPVTPEVAQPSKEELMPVVEAAPAVVPEKKEEDDSWFPGLKKQLGGVFGGDEETPAAPEKKVEAAPMPPAALPEPPALPEAPKMEETKAEVPPAPPALPEVKAEAAPQPVVPEVMEKKETEAKLPEAPVMPEPPALPEMKVEEPKLETVEKTEKPVEEDMMPPALPEAPLAAPDAEAGDSLPPLPPLPGAEAAEPELPPLPPLPEQNQAAVTPPAPAGSLPPLTPITGEPDAATKVEEVKAAELPAPPSAPAAPEEKEMATVEQPPAVVPAPPPAPAAPEEKEMATVEQPPAVVPVPVETEAAKPAASGSGAPALQVVFKETETSVPLSLKPQLTELVNKAKAKPNTRLTIVGYAAGTEEQASTARRVSLSRAYAVRAALIDQGMESLNINVKVGGTKSGSGPADRVDVFAD